MDYNGIVLYILVQCLVSVESSAHLPASYSVVPFLAATQEIHCSTYIASHIVGHGACDSPQANGVLPPTEDPFLHTKYLEEIG